MEWLRYFTFLAVTALVVSSPIENNAEGAENCTSGDLMPHIDCEKYYMCVEKKWLLMQCPNGEQFDHQRVSCDKDEKVRCAKKETEAPLAPLECPKESDNLVLLPHETQCNLFYSCSNGAKIQMTCPANLLFNVRLSVCDWPDQVQCEGRQTTVTGSTDVSTSSTESDVSTASTESDVSTTSTESAVSNGSSASEESSEPSESVSETTENTEADQKENEGSGNSPSECPKESENLVLLPHESQCNLFYSCSNGAKIQMTCPANLLFNVRLSVCDWPDQVQCEGRQTTVTGSTDVSTSSTESDVSTASTESDVSTTSTESDVSTGPSRSEGSGESSEESDESSEESESTESAAQTTENAQKENEGSGNLASECPKESDLLVLLPHESKCNLFYSCSNGAKIEMTCPEGLLFNPKISVCDWPVAVDCPNKDNASTPVPESTTESEECDAEEDDDDEKTAKALKKSLDYIYTQ